MKLTKYTPNTVSRIFILCGVVLFGFVNYTGIVTSALGAMIVGYYVYLILLILTIIIFFLAWVNIIKKSVLIDRIIGIYLVVNFILFFLPGVAEYFFA